MTMESNFKRVYAQSQAEAVYTSCGDLIRYLTGFFIEDGFAVIDKNGVALYTDKRYLESAKKILQGKVAVKERSRDVTPLTVLSNYKNVAIPYEDTPLTEYLSLQSLPIELKDASTAFSQAMEIKTEEELTKIQKACSIAEDGFLKTLPEIKEGMTELEVAAILECKMKTLGAYSTSFDTIVAFGKNASVPHHETGETKLKFGDEILIDFGCKVNGYCSDITRTFLFGDDKKHEGFKKLYGEVLTAHLLVKEKYKTGMTGSEIDGIAREYLKSKGLDKYFTHSLGHGVGLRIHEEPRISPSSQTVIKENMVFSNEPGVYIENELGIRIEDTVTVKDGSIQSFMHKTDKKLVII